MKADGGWRKGGRRKRMRGREEDEEEEDGRKAGHRGERRDSTADSARPKEQPGYPPGRHRAGDPLASPPPRVKLEAALCTPNLEQPRRRQRAAHPGTYRQHCRVPPWPRAQGPRPSSAPGQGEPYGHGSQEPCSAVLCQMLPSIKCCQGCSSARSASNLGNSLWLIIPGPQAMARVTQQAAAQHSQHQPQIGRTPHQGPTFHLDPRTPQRNLQSQRFHAALLPCPLQDCREKIPQDGRHKSTA